MLKNDSEDVKDAVDQLYGLKAGLMAQLAFVKGKLMAHKKLKGPATMRKVENSCAQVVQRITGLKKNRKINISKRPLAVITTSMEKKNLN